MRLLAVLSVVLVALTALAGCAAPPPEPTPAPPPEPAPETGPTFGPDGPLASGGMHVLVVSASVRLFDAKTGDVTLAFPAYVCDMASPPFSADDEPQTLWYVPTDGDPNDPRAGDLAIIRLDVPMLRSPACWTPTLDVHGNQGNLTWDHPDGPRTLPVRLEEGGVRVDGFLLTPGDEVGWPINASCHCALYGGDEDDYRIEGTLHVMYLGDWGDPVLVDDVRDLPPMNVPHGRPSLPENASTPTGPGMVPVLLLSGTVVESGPEYALEGYCGVSAPSMEIDPERQTIEYASWVPVHGAHDLFLVDRVRMEAMHDDGCEQLPRLRSGNGTARTTWDGLTAVRVGDRVRVGDALLAPGGRATVVVDWNVTESRNGQEGTWRYRGELDASWPYVWPRGNITVMS